MTDSATTRVIEHDEANASFVDSVAELLQRAFGKWPRLDLAVSARDHLEWKMSGPLPGFPAAIIAELDGRIAGYRTVLARRLLVRHQPRMFLHFVDAAVEPELQGRGVNGAMRRLMTEEFNPRFDLSIDDGTVPSIVRGRERLATIHTFGNTVRPYVLPLDAARLLRSRPATRIPPWLAAPLLRIASRITRLRAPGHRGPATDCAIRTVDTFDPRFDDLCDRAAERFDFIAERNAAFLNWRYADPRAGAFTIRIAERGDQLLGYAVTRQDADTTKVADLLVTPEEPAVAAALIADAVQTARANGSAAVGCWLPQRHPYRGALSAAGFVALGRTTSLVYRAVSMTDEQLAFLREPDTAIHFTEGDTDFI